MIMVFGEIKIIIVMMIQQQCPEHSEWPYVFSSNHGRALVKKGYKLPRTMKGSVWDIRDLHSYVTNSRMGKQVCGNVLDVTRSLGVTAHRRTHNKSNKSSCQKISTVCIRRSRNICLQCWWCTSFFLHETITFAHTYS